MNNIEKISALEKADSLDVITTGTVFADIVFSGLPALPRPGEEIYAGSLASAPGGVANLAFALARLGLKTALATDLSSDQYGIWIRSCLMGEGVDLSACSYSHTATAVTVAMALAHDRAMVSYAEHSAYDMASVVASMPVARSAVADLRADTSWWATLARRGTKIFADAGFDDAGEWSKEDLRPLENAYGFTPNALEALAYTRADSIDQALTALAEYVPLIAITDGSNGARALDQNTGETASYHALPVQAIDSTGAGDVFASGLVYGTLAQWPLDIRLRFSILCSALCVEHMSGSFAAPGWAEIRHWWIGVTQAASAGDAQASELASDYGFLADIVPEHAEPVRRALPTFC